MLTEWQDVRYTVRSLLKSTGFAAIAVLSVVNGVLLNPLPYPHSYGDLRLDGPQIGTGFWRPVDRNALGGGVLTHCFGPSSRRTSSCGMLSPRASEALARPSAAAVWS